MARPSKISEDTWADARAYYEADKSLRDIEKLTGINNSNLSKKAKAENWQRGILPQLITDTTRVKEEFTALLPHQQKIVTAEVTERLRDLIFYNKTQNRFAQIAKEIIENKHAEKELSVMELAGASRVVKDSREGVIGKAPETVINNTNAQQTNIGVITQEERDKLYKAMDALY